MSAPMESDAGSGSKDQRKKGKKPEKPQPSGQEKQAIAEARRVATKAMATIWQLKDRKNELQLEMEKTTNAIRDLEGEFGFAKEPEEMTEVIWDTAGTGRVKELKRKHDEVDEATSEGKKRKKDIWKKIEEHEKKVDQLKKFKEISSRLTYTEIVDALWREKES